MPTQTTRPHPARVQKRVQVVIGVAASAIILEETALRLEKITNHPSTLLQLSFPAILLANAHVPEDRVREPATVSDEICEKVALLLCERHYFRVFVFGKGGVQSYRFCLLGQQLLYSHFLFNGRQRGLLSSQGQKPRNQRFLQDDAVAQCLFLFIA